jgi:stage V sporulation protein R
LNLGNELRKLKERVEEAALELGLEFPEVAFELVDPDQLNMVAAYGGFPVRYPHWRHGMEFQHLHERHRYGLGRIYELVINTDPCYAYLMTTNTMTDQKLVMAHVYGHADFFLNNLWFAPTDRKMIDTMANHATRVRRHVDSLGPEKVEAFLDACLSLENLIDPMSLYMRRHRHEDDDPEVDEERLAAERVQRFPVERSYMEPYVNPKVRLDAERKRLAAALREGRRHPREPVRDVLLFLLQNAPLADWQADCLAIVREEAYYFAPQRMTKIINEGWAVWVHSQLMTTRLVESNEVLEYCSRHAGTLASQPGQINPYRLGYSLFKDIEDRWDHGRHGVAWSDCDDWEQKRTWDTAAMDGRRKVFEARRIHSDQTFLDAFLTPEFIEREKLFIYGRDPRTGQMVIQDREPASVKRKLLEQFTNMGSPMIDVVDANFENRGELLLEHSFETEGLREDFARATLVNLHLLWTRPVHIRTRHDDKRVLWSYDGREHKSREL